MKGVYANVIVDISHEKVDRPFQYKVPEAFMGKLEAGMEVLVPFGKGNKERSAYIMELTDKAEYPEEKMKEISAVAERSTKAETFQIRLAWWMKERYGSTMITALKTVIPARRKTEEKTNRHLVLALSKEAAQEVLAEFEKKHWTARARLLSGLISQGEMSYPMAQEGFKASAETVRALEKQGILRIDCKTVYRNPLHMEKTGKERNTLSENQRQVISDISESLKEGNTRVNLLHGITGSGKTEVYMALIEEMVKQGKQSIVLIPEIALTYQTVSRFYERFGERVSVMHSRLSAGEKYDQCRRAKKGELDVMIGPRSALFTPFSNLGLIVMDEEHEPSYKSEQIPKYHARETACKLASFYGAGVVLGSATPSLEAYYAAKQGKIKLYTLKERLAGGSLPRVYVEDLREELKQGNRSIFSRHLQALLQERLARKEQTMLFLNRRGYAGFVSCRFCGHVMKCPHCDISLSEHKNGKLICHYCGHEEPSVKKCPVCGSSYIMGFRAGTEQIEEQLHKQFPEAKVLRMDADTTRKKDSYEEILSAFLRKEADILVGTQMIVKGHDFPNVTLVGILAADLSLAAGDFRAAERTFQLLTQAAGRAGRSEKPGEVIIQTYQPDHHSILHAANQDYESFYEEEMLYRGLGNYPPVGHMMAVLITGENQDRTKALAERLAKAACAFAEDDRVYKKADRVGVIGPAPASVGKLSDSYRYVFYMKKKDTAGLIRVKDFLEEELEKKELSGEMVSFDLDPAGGY